MLLVCHTTNLNNVSNKTTYILIELFFQMSNVENLSPQCIRQVVKELQDLVKTPPEGIKVYLNEQDITDIQAFIEGPGK